MMISLRVSALALVATMLAACGGSAPTISGTGNLAQLPAPPESALAAMDTMDLRTHTAELSSDAYEGRGTGTPGEAKAVEYIIRQLRAAGFAGGMPDGSFTQDVPLRSVQVTETTELTFSDPAGQTVSLDLGDEFIGFTDLKADGIDFADVPVVFVGYGIENAGFRWDDYKGMDVSGKLIISFVNDPPATAAEPNLFQADTLTYNGRWTYKYEEARRRGALGVLLIHTDETAGYPFTVLNGDARGAHTMGADVPAGALQFRGWMPQASAESVAALAGTTLDSWFSQAASRDFRPAELPVTADLRMQFAHAAGVVGQNVVAKLAGRTRPNEAVVFGAHHDHLGRDAEKEARGEDGIYNGAVDNASGVAMMLELADAFSKLPEAPERSVYLVTFSAEESGLLGSEHFAQHPPVPLANIIANVNVDSGNLAGATDDIVGIGSERSELKRLLREVATAEGLTVTPDPSPNQGSFFRSDQLAFARGGVPAVFVNTGERFRGREAGYAAQVRNDYRQNRYHQPSDEMLPWMRFDGILQQTRVAFRLGYGIANSSIRPTWRESEAFGATRAESERAANGRTE